MDIVIWQGFRSKDFAEGTGKQPGRQRFQSKRSKSNLHGFTGIMNMPFSFGFP